MGINGLLRCLSEETKRVHISEFRNKTIAVDGYCWLHKAAYSCASEICRGIKTSKYLSYCLHMIGLLKHNGITPIVIFDGSPLPAKKGEVTKRQIRRQENLELGKKYHSEGNTSMAWNYFRRATNVTPDMAWEFIKKLKEQGIETIVAPYEADAQLAYLIREKIADLVITEDSDLIPYGVDKILFKLEKSGEAQYLDLNNNININININSNNISLEKKEEKEEREKSKGKKKLFASFSQEDIRHTCILAGCDYLPSISGMGVRKAAFYVGKYRKVKKIFQMIRLSGSFKIPENYENGFRLAELTFLFQRVYDPRTSKLVTLNDVSLAGEILSEEEHIYIGPNLNQIISQRIAQGIIHPVTYEFFDPNLNEKSSNNEKSTNNSIQMFCSEVSEITDLEKNLDVNSSPSLLSQSKIENKRRGNLSENNSSITDFFKKIPPNNKMESDDDEDDDIIFVKKDEINNNVIQIDEGSSSCYWPISSDLKKDDKSKKNNHKDNRDNSFEKRSSLPKDISKQPLKLITNQLKDKPTSTSTKTNNIQKRSLNIDLDHFKHNPFVINETKETRPLTIESIQIQKKKKTCRPSNFSYTL